MERVQYSLERTLPSLHTLDTTRTFTRDELRALTAQRASLETALVRRIAARDGADYIAYVAFEDKVEKLRLVRTAKAQAEAHRDKTRAKSHASPNANANASTHNDEPVVGGTKEQQARMRAAYLARCISIFERGVTKLKDSLPLWQAYLAWARARNMRTLVGRVFARALNLHTTHIALWIQAAGYELGTNFAANTARLLLQRGISLNTLAFTEVALPAGEAGLPQDTESERPKKRRKGAKGSTTTTTTTITTHATLAAAHTVQHRPIAFTINLTPGERDLLRLWVEYARMELVFLERLRRRWAILGLASDGAATTIAPSSTSTTSSGRPQGGISQRFVLGAAAAPSPAAATTPIPTARLVALPGDHAEGIDDEAAQEELALSGDSPAQQRRAESDALRAAGAQAEEEQEEEEEQPSLPAPPPGTNNVVRTPAQAAQQAIMHGGLLAPLVSTAFAAVAPKLRLALALSLLRLVRVFPLLDAAEAEADRQLLDGGGVTAGEGATSGTSAATIRASLSAQILDAFADATRAVPALAPTAEGPSTSAHNGAARALLLAARPIFLRALPPRNPLSASRAGRERERETNALLRAQGRLCPVDAPELDGVLAAARAGLLVAAKKRAEQAERRRGRREGGPDVDADDDAPTYLLAHELVEALAPLASAPPAQRTALPTLLAQLVGNLLQCAAAAAVAVAPDTRKEAPSSGALGGAGSKGKGKGKGGGGSKDVVGDTSAITAAYYGLALTAEGEQARFPVLAAQLLRFVLEARVRRRKARKDVEKEEREEEEGDRDGDDAAETEDDAGAFLIQEENLRALLETAIQRLLPSLSTAASK